MNILRVVFIWALSVGEKMEKQTGENGQQLCAGVLSKKQKLVMLSTSKYLEQDRTKGLAIERKTSTNKNCEKHGNEG